MDQKTRQFVLLRDGGCVARFANSNFWAGRWPMLQGLPDAGECRNSYGTAIGPTTLWLMEADHVKVELGMPRQDDIAQLWTMCPFHHRGKTTTPGWATLVVVRGAARIYIAAANEYAAKEGWPPYPVAEDDTV